MIHRHAGGERMIRPREPAGKRETAAAALLGNAGNCRGDQAGERFGAGGLGSGERLARRCQFFGGFAAERHLFNAASACAPSW